jgi:phosphatidylethanolamine/phosphatidyl-N-methylethanolamine N-methyltransferase
MLNRFLPQPDNRYMFVRGFLQYPHLVASVFPSSRFLERRLVETAEIANAGLVVELGPGTGGTTRAFLRAMSENSKLLAIELVPQFVTLLQSCPDPRLISHLGSAEDLTSTLTTYGLARPDTVISGIPFSTMPPETARRIISATWSALAPGGSFVTYQISNHVECLTGDLAGPPVVAYELLNIPPVRICKWRKPLGWY